MIKAVRETGRIPVQRDTFYQPVKIWDKETSSAVDESERSEVLENNLSSP
jgi:hypothetical protein